MKHSSGGIGNHAKYGYDFLSQVGAEGLTLEGVAADGLLLDVLRVAVLLELEEPHDPRQLVVADVEAPWAALVCGLTRLVDAPALSVRVDGRCLAQFV